MAKSVVLTYVFWLLGGWFGLHHLYLGRDRHAFIWFSTLGGFIGLGLFRDLWKIPEYVRDANEDGQYMEMLTLKMRHSPSGPSFSFLRLCGAYIVGYQYAVLFSSFLPYELVPLKAVVPFLPFVAALGVTLVSSIGREQGSLLWANIGSYLAWLLVGTNPENIGSAALVSAIVVQLKGKKWKRTITKRHFCQRFFILTLCYSVYTAMWGSSLLYNTYVHTKYGEKVRFKDALQNFFNSPAWTETKQTFSNLYEHYQEHGWEKLYEELGKGLDPEGEDHSYRVLGLNPSASDEEVTKAYRSLVKQWHPDKIKDPAKKEEAAEKFMQIQQAYEKLTQIRTRRSKKGHGG